MAKLPLSIIHRYEATRLNPGYRPLDPYSTQPEHYYIAHASREEGKWNGLKFGWGKSWNPDGETRNLNRESVVLLRDMLNEVLQDWPEEKK